MLRRGSVTNAFLVDGPLMTEVEPDTTGFYAIVSGTRSGWKGGGLFIDVGSGATVNYFGQSETVTGSGTQWALISNSNTVVSHGFALTALSPNGKAMCWDRKSKVNVLLYDINMVLNSATKYDIVTMGLNFCLIGDEYVAFAGARDLGNGIWQLDTFLRGLRGTETSIGAHVSGERFVRALPNSVKRIQHDNLFLNREGTYRASSNGQDLESSVSFTFTNTGNSFRPPAPIITRKNRDGSGEIYLRWLPRKRQFGNWISEDMPLTLDQPDEEYEIDVYQSAVFKATHSFSSLREWTYTTAAQATDSISDDDIEFRLYQVSQIIGRGYANIITITYSGEGGLLSGGVWHDDDFWRDDSVWED